MSVITLAHGNGGKKMRHLISELFSKYFANPFLNTELDGALLPWEDKQLIMTTDGFTVQPLFFPGGSIGSLAVHGTVNDLAVSGAKPLYMTLNVFIEEGFLLVDLEKIVQDIAQAAKQAEVAIVAGDTKVLPKGEINGIYLATTGIGYPKLLDLGLKQIQVGDKILINGSVGDHGTAVMLAREEFGLHGKIKSDAASVLPFTELLWEMPGIKFMRDPTRGGLATVAHEIAISCQLGIRLLEEYIPVKESVIAVCEMLGYDPYYLACEGRVIAIVAAEQADLVLKAWQTIHPEAAIIGEITTEDSQVILETCLGGERILPELISDPLPRIC